MSPMIDQMRESKFLKQSDVGKAILVTIAECDQQNVNKEGADPELKWCLHFNEVEKPLVLNATNIQLCAQACGSKNTDDWKGKRIVLYVDPNVSYAGKLTGGIRVRKPKATAPPPPPPMEEAELDDVPF